MRILLFLLLLSPLCASAQILRAYGVIEIGSFPTSSATGPKFAYRPADSSFYRWVSGSTWIKIIPDEPDTLYLKQLSGTTALADGDTIDISTYLLKADTASMLAAYVKLVGYGLIKTGQTIRVDTTSPNGLATRKYAILNPTTIAANAVVKSNGANLVAGAITENGSRVVLGLPTQLKEYSLAGLPTGVTKDMYWVTGSGPAWYQGARVAYALESEASRFTAGSLIFASGNGQARENTAMKINTTDIQFPYALRPETDNTHDLGLANRRWRTTYAITTVTDQLRIATIETLAGIPWLSSITGIGQTNGFYFNPATGRVSFLALGTRAHMQTGEMWNYFDTHYFGISSGTVSGSSSEKVQIQGNLYINGNTKSTGSVGIGTGAINYSLEQLSKTDAFGIARGTVAQRPTIVSSTTPIRYNTDSTSIEYGESVGVWRQLATRAYARSLVSALPTTNIYTANGTLTGNRTLTGGGFSLTLNAKTIASDTLLLPIGKVKTNTYAPIMGKNVNWAENGSVMYGENLRKDSTGYGAGANVLFGKDLMQKARTGGGRFALFGDDILNGITNAYNVVALGIQVANEYTGAGSDFFIGGTQVARYATNLDGSVILATLSFNRTAGVDLNQTVAFGHGLGNANASRSAGGTHLGYQQIPNLVDGVRISTYGYQAGRVIKRGTNLSFMGNFTGATDTMFSDASAIGNYAAIGQNQSITIGAINGINGASYDAKIGIGTVTPEEKFTLIGNAKLGSYGAGSKEASDLSLGTPTYIAAFAPSGTGQGTIVDYRIARDTFIEDVTLFSVGTLLNTCQELTIVSSMTVFASSNMEIRFPDAGDHLRGRKIIVYSKKKDAGSFIPQIKVVGGVSRLYFTTNPAVGGTDPSDQSTLNIDDGTWSDHGTTFEFTCLKIDNTPSYRWVLKQR